MRYLFRSGLTSPLLVRGPHYTHVYLLHAVYCQTLLASQLDFETYITRSSYTYLDVIHIAIVYGERDLLELRFGSIRSRDLLDLTCLYLDVISHRNCVRRT